MILRRVPNTLSLSRRFFSSKDTPDLSSSIVKFNKELEDIFGGPPASGPSGSSDCRCVSLENRVPEISDVPDKLTHIGSQGKAQMVDVSPKEDTKRTAIASCKVLLGKKVFDLMSANQGEASTTAKTGVEMEAMTAVTIAGLTVYDMCKAASKNIEITSVRLEHKAGGKSGA